MPAGGLAGQIVLNAKASTTPTQWWSGTIKVGNDIVVPNNFSPDFPPPSYTPLPAALGGGSIGVVPFAIRNVASFPLRSATTDLRQLATQQFVGLGNSIRLAFYGPLATPAPLIAPVTFVRFGPDGNDPDVDVTNLFTLSVNPTGRRELFISPAPGLPVIAFLGNSTSGHATRHYRGTPVAAVPSGLGCDSAALLPGPGSKNPPAALATLVNPFSFDFALIYSCDGDDVPDPDQIASIPCYDCYDPLIPGGQGSDGILDSCQNPPNGLKVNGIWTHCTACTGSCQYGVPAEFNANGVISTDDIFAFLGAWFAQRPCVDVDGSGLNVQDILKFLSA